MKNTTATLILSAMRLAATRSESARNLSIRRSAVAETMERLGKRVKIDWCDAGEYLDVWTTGRTEMRAILAIRPHV